MATVQELHKIGEQCGLEGNLLKDFIREQQAIDRAERERNERNRKRNVRNTKSNVKKKRRNVKKKRKRGTAPER